jgi:phospholipid/cholesterol/gamma-HCH transport system ATP-binding protein
MAAMISLARQYACRRRATPTACPQLERVPPPLPVSPAIEFDTVCFGFDDQAVLDALTFSVPRGSMTILLGASGAGKSVVLKLALGLFKPDSGRILVNGQRIDDMRERELDTVRATIGMLFQENALFSSLTVGENVGYRLSEELRMPRAEVDKRVAEVLSLVGLDSYADVMPADLSGGQRRRVAIARAVSARPTLVLLDDPTSGLDPITATGVDDQILKLRDLEGVTSLVATHQMRDAFYLATHQAVGPDIVRIGSVASGSAPSVRFLVLHEGRVYFEGSAAELQTSTDPYLRDFLFMTLPPW